MSQYDRMHRWLAAIVLVVSGIVYLSTIAPTLSFWDCGEFITASVTMSVPHPPGAPFFLLLGRFFSLLPLGDPGHRVNLISVISSAFTVMFLYLIIVKLIRIMRGREKDAGDFLLTALPALVAAFTFAFTHSFWFNAVEAEVYAISMFFTSIIVWMIFAWKEHADQHHGDRFILLIFYMIALSIGVHLLNILALPAIFLVIYYHKYPAKTAGEITLAWVISTLMILPIYPGIVQKLPLLVDRFGIGAIVVLFALAVGGVYYFIRIRNQVGMLISGAVLLVLIGYFSYAIILIRSGMNPPLDENNPETITALIKYLNREQYGAGGLLSSIWPRRADLNYQFNYMYLRYLMENFFDFRLYYGIPMFMGLWGLVYHFGKDWKHASVVLNLFLMTGLAIVVYVNQDNPQPRERDYSYVGSYFAFSIWIGIGIYALMEVIADLKTTIARRKTMLITTGLIFTLIMPVNMLARTYHSQNRQGNYVAWDYAYNMLNTLEPDAIIFTNGDNDTFPLWYLQYVEHIREDVQVVNLSLLNTGWYIKQLRDKAPTAPTTMKDDFLDRYVDGHDLESLRWRYLPSPRNVSLRTTRGDSITFRVNPTYRLDIGDDSQGNNFLRVQDLMILDILHANKWKRPIYFAVTVSSSNQVGLQNYLRMDGLAFRVLDRKVQGEYDVDLDILRHNVMDVYADHYRNLNNPKVYFNDDIKRMLQNYRSAYLQLAMAYWYKGQMDDGLAVLRKMDEYLPESTVPTFSPELSLQIGQLYQQMGDTAELVQRLELFLKDNQTQADLLTAARYYIEYVHDNERAYELMSRVPRNVNSYGTLGDMYLAAGEPDSALVLYQTGLAVQPFDPNLYGGLITAYEDAERWTEAIQALDQWLKKHPGDRSAASKLEGLREEHPEVP